MSSTGKSLLIELKASDALIDFDEYLSEIRTYLPSLNEDDAWIRSGIHIGEKYKKHISSFRLFGNQTPKIGRARIEVLLVKTQIGVSISDAAPHCAGFIRDHLTKTGTDAAFVALVPSTGEGWRTFFVKSPLHDTVDIPEDILTHTCSGALKIHIKKACGLSDAAVDGYFSFGYALFDDTVIRAKAKEIDKTLRYLKFCDIASGSGQMLHAMAGLVAKLRSGLNKYLGSHADRTEKNFTEQFLTGSLYASDYDAGALEILKTMLRMQTEKKIDDRRFVWGNILTEDLFEGMLFDVIATNPPHMKQDEFSFIKEKLESYASFSHNTDLYCYYAEKAFGLVTENGGVGVLMSNRWMRSGYGVGLRHFLSQKNITEIVDYANIPPVKGISTPLSILVGSNDTPSEDVSVTVVEDADHENISLYVEEQSATQTLSALSDEGWVFDAEDTAALMNKITDIGVPLEEYVEGHIYRGILTGLNEAFAPDRATAEKIIEKDPNSSKILRPFLSGRNVKRYAIPTIKKYLVFLPKGITDKMRGDMGPEEWLCSQYPAIAEHLAQYEEKASKRRDKGDYWWELRSCRYYEKFEKTKIICPTIVKHISATIDTNGLFSNDKTSIIASGDFYLLGLLNSNLMDFYMRRICTELLNEHYEVKPANLAVLPIKKISPTNSFHVNLKTEIENGAMALSKLCSVPEKERTEDINEDIREAERVINRAVARLYRLSAGEISLIENY